MEFLEGSLTANKIMPTCLMTMTVQRQKNGSKEKSPPETNRAYVGSRKSAASYPLHHWGSTQDTVQASQGLYLWAASPAHKTDLLATLGPPQAKLHFHNSDGKLLPTQASVITQPSNRPEVTFQVPEQCFCHAAFFRKPLNVLFSFWWNMSKKKTTGTKKEWIWGWHRWREEDQEFKVKPVTYRSQGQPGIQDTLLRETEGDRQANRRTERPNTGIQKRNKGDLW